MPGTVYDDIAGSGCIPVDHCHCKLHGHLYVPGQQVTNDCEQWWVLGSGAEAGPGWGSWGWVGGWGWRLNLILCSLPGSVCNAGRWVCKDLPCPGTCTLEGGSHITTFDGKKYTFHGDCYYVLSKVGWHAGVRGGAVPPHPSPLAAAMPLRSHRATRTPLPSWES